MQRLASKVNGGIEVGKLCVGMTLGEDCLKGLNQPTTMKCETDVKVACLTLRDYKIIIDDILKQKETEKVEFIMSIPEFGKLVKSAVSKLSPHFITEEKIKGQVIYEQGAEIDFMYLIWEGECEQYLMMD
jgi:hypothetical protein